MAKKYKKKDLGLGIRALIQSDVSSPAEKKKVVKKLSSSVAMIEISKIHPNPNQPRREFDREALNELAESIKIHGIIQPITLKQDGDDSFLIISGERRYRASQIAGLKELPAYIRIANDQEVMEMALIENIQREDLNPLEVAITYSRLMKEFSLTHESMAERVGKKRSTISNFLRLLELPPTIQNALKEKQISTGHAKALQGLRTIDDQLFVLNRIINDQLSVRETEKIARMRITGSGESRKAKAPKELPQDYKTIVKDLKSHLGAMVDIKLNGKDKGQILIKFANVEELNRILEIIEE